MGEKKNNKEGENKEDKKKDETNKNQDKKGDGVKKEDIKTPTVLKVEMHCDGCAKKVIRSVKRIEGVEGVMADSSTSKVTVFGKIDPLKLREKVELKTKKKVELISPIPKKDKDAGEADKKPEEKPDKKKEPQVTTATFKTRLHCEGCTQKIHKSISKIKGVEAVTIDKLQDLVTVKGTMDVKDLPSYLQKKHKRTVEFLLPKSEDKKEGDKKDKADGKEKKASGGDENKENGAKPEESMANRMDYYGPGYGNGYGYGHGYRVDPPPQMFSDENPNACSIM
ncbi:hypothetical protein IFM89_007493 [Coptis chinensis]|uniref:HMA domain-containing protein n=1 Tax=Coptis chinensis TaxID=261450 RepID=A0A835HBT6_9MAGN|nr:hypothetical protein IFM89_007493 [Coptis chinensis]